MDEAVHNKHKNSLSIAVALWVALMLFFIIFILFTKHIYHYSITWVYWDASINWLKGQQMYNADKVSVAFVYFPHSAILQIPFAVLPFRLAEILWRILNVALLGWSCYLVAKIWEKHVDLNYSFLIITIVTIPLSYYALRNGQLNNLLTVICCISAYLLYKNKYKTAVVLCFIGLALKPYMIIPLLLILGVYPKRTFWTAALCLVAFIIFPFLFQSPHYVLQEYKECFIAFSKQDAKGIAVGYSNIYGIFNALGISVNKIIVTLSSALAGIVIYISSVFYFKRNRNIIGPVIMIALSVIYILLFNPKTEYNTFCMIAPFIGFFIIGGLNCKMHSYTTIATICAFLIFQSLALALREKAGQYIIFNAWLAPLMLVLFTVVTLSIVIKPIMKTFKNDIIQLLVLKSIAVTTLVIFQSKISFKTTIF